MSDSKILPSQQIEIDVWNEKYRFWKVDGTTDEQTIEDSFARVVEGVFAKDKGPKAKAAKRSCWEAMLKREIVPAGRQHAGAGTGRDVTLINCYVSPTIQDSMRSTLKSGNYMSAPAVGIFDAVSVAAFTQQMGGGIGMDFSELRPKGALVEGVGVPSSGPLFFMDTWDAMCQTIRSAGNRRGAMMGTLRCDHPDILDFIKAKQEGGRLTNFNVSVLITDAFMDAVRNDKTWLLGFHKPKTDGQHLGVVSKNPYTGAGGEWYVYKEMPARELWSEITKSTYVYAEPGVMFIDRINKANNLWYCEHIATSNPCFTGDTKVWTIHGNVRFDDLAKSGKTIPVLTQLDNGQLAFRDMISPRLTRKDQKVVAVQFRGGGRKNGSITSVECTPDHIFYLKNGKKK